MRMWGVKPNMLCRQHLLGEHLELHMFAGTILSKKSLGGYIKKGLVDTSKIKDRHQELVKEMEKRGYKHSSPLPHFSVKKAGKIDIEANKKELCRRCKDCRKNIR